MKLNIRDPSTFTEQRLFDFVVGKLIEQKKQSVNVYGCVYRGDNGLKCAIGHCIPDELYDPIMEQRPVTGLTTEFPGLEHLGRYLSLFNHLQVAHDFQKNAKALKMRLRYTAGLFDLNPAVVNFITEWE